MISILLAMAVTVGPTVVPVAADKDPCCFTNPRFTGECKVVPAGDTTCTDILNYLNNPNSVGKTYCSNTKVRLGWQQVSCDQKQSEACTGVREGQIDRVSDTLP